MKFCSTILGLAAVAHSASAHYIFNALITHGATTPTAVRMPQNNSPVKPVTSLDMRCNVNPFPATSTVKVAAGSTIGFTVNVPIYHQGPAAIYLGKAPGSAASWNGSGRHWFKIAQWGAHLDPFGFKSLNKTQLTTTIPKSTPSGQYLVRVEQLGLHVIPPESFMSCAQIEITHGGSGTPGPKVSIPGYIGVNDANVNVDIYPPSPKSYTCPGPAVWRG